MKTNSHKLSTFDRDDVTLHLPVSSADGTSWEPNLAALDSWCTLAELVEEYDDNSGPKPLFVMAEPPKPVPFPGLAVLPALDCIYDFAHLDFTQRPDTLVKDYFKELDDVSYNDFTFPKDCLTLELGHRLTQFIPDDKDNVKLLIAPSGSGKTRTCLEILFQQYGIYFTFGSEVIDMGSFDIGSCMSKALKDPNSARDLSATLLWCRWTLVKHLISLSWRPDQVLFAQLYPVRVFGKDIFLEFFNKIVQAKAYASWDFRVNDLVVVADEIQTALQGNKIFEGTEPRPFCSPLLQGLKTSTHTLIFSGTGIDYEIFQDCMLSPVAKDNRYQHQEVVRSSRNT